MSSLPSTEAIRAEAPCATSAPARRADAIAPTPRAARRQPAATALLPWIVPALLLLAWGLGARHGWISPQVLPDPRQVVDTLAESARSGLLWSSAWISLLRTGAGFAIALLAGLPLGVAMGLSPALRDYLYPLLKIVAYVPLLGWLPLLVMMLGIGEPLKFALIAKAALVPVVINTCNGVRGVPAPLLELADVYGLTRWQTLRKVILPAAFSQAWSGVRYGVAVAWLTMVAVEYLAASEGLGYLMASGQQLAQLDLVIVAAIAIAALGLAIDKALALVERSLLRWRRSAT